MGVAGAGNAEVTVIVCAVAGLGQGTQGHYLYHGLNILTLHRCQELLDILWFRVFRNVNGKAHNGDEPFQ